MAAQLTGKDLDAEPLYLGVKGSVAAFHQATGQELWRTHLKGSSFVTLAVSGDRIFAHTGGHLFCVEKASGGVLWCNDLPGLGYGLASIALAGSPPDIAPIVKQIQAQQAAAAASSTGVPGS